MTPATQSEAPVDRQPDRVRCWCGRVQIPYWRSLLGVHVGEDLHTTGGCLVGDECIWSPEMAEALQ